ncbi:MAG: HEPN domain-containing protein [Spirochaetales bacterium]|nr:HEPN domain-containing protein [Spirochaetales bacterium]
MNNNELAKEWLGYSKIDLKSAEFLTQMRPEPLEIICFHCQQSVEKALKAFLYSRKIRPPRTHDLDELISLCDNNRISDIREMTIPLNDYSVMIRYPSHEEVNDQDKIQALEIAKSTVSLIENIILKL